jgi:hypothetical protein
VAIADCVTSLGGMPVLVDENGIDIAYSCTQKGLGCPPGLSPMTVSARALDRLKARTAPVQSWYLDLQLLDTFYSGHKYHHTASATLFYALREGLAMVAEEGLENRWERHRRNHQAFVAGIEAMGLEMHVANPADRLWTLNTPRLPSGVDDAKVRGYLLERFGMEIAGGFGPLAGKVLRIGTMGRWKPRCGSKAIGLPAMPAAPPKRRWLKGLTHASHTPGRLPRHRERGVAAVGAPAIGTPRRAPQACVPGSRLPMPAVAFERSTRETSARFRSGQTRRVRGLYRTDRNKCWLWIRCPHRCMSARCRIGCFERHRAKGLVASKATHSTQPR